MHDIKSIRDNPEAFDAGLARRGLAPISRIIMRIDAQRRDLMARVQGGQERRNALSKQIGELKRQGETQVDGLMAEVNLLKASMATADATIAQLESEMARHLSEVANIPANDVPQGADESGNVERHKVGTPRNFAFTPKQHFEIGEGLGLMDFETASKISGARFVILKGDLARLERALSSFMLDLHTKEHGYTEVNPPLLVRDDAMYGTGQLPKFADDLFKTFPGAFSLDKIKSSVEKNLDTSAVQKADADKIVEDLSKKIYEGLSADAGAYRWMIPTSEVPLTNMVRDDVVDVQTLPRRYTAATPCFRAEAGAAGRDTRGMIRLHQFLKVELVSITTPDTSEAEHERMLQSAEAVLKKLDLPFRTITLCTGDMGFSARKTYDIEVWLPGQNAYREISSCSNCGDFQARRMNARFKMPGEKGTQFVHTLNGSGVAVGRCLVAVLENYQNADGSITVPEVLQPYMGGTTEIRA